MRKDFAYGIVPVFRNGNDPLFLIVQSREGYWGFPKGHLEGSESELEAARRELWEETGIKDIEIDIDNKFMTHAEVEKDGEVYTKTNLFFLGYPKFTTISTPPDFKEEIRCAEWHNAKDARRLMNYPAYSEVLDKVIQILNSKHE